MPIARNKNIVPLSREHHHGLLFCWKIRQGKKLNINIERVVQYIIYFWRMDLKPHFDKEEQSLFHLLNDKISIEGYIQHKEIEKQINFFQNDNYCWQDCLHLANILEQHIRFEERVLFPHFEQQLSDLQLNDIGHFLIESEQLTEDDGYEDKFWTKPSSH